MTAGMTEFGMAQGISALAAFATVHLLVAPSPGPAFLAVSRGKAKRGLDALFGGFLTALGVKLALEQ